MADSLYPTFDVPTVYATDIEAQRAYYPGPVFDFEQGDFVRDENNSVVIGDGFAAFHDWCLKVLNTQFGACTAYPNIGILGEEAGAGLTREAVQTAYERTIIEALKVHPATERVKDFVFTWRADTLAIQCTIEGADWAAFDVTLNVV